MAALYSKMVCYEGQVCNSVYCFEVTQIVVKQERFDGKYKVKKGSGWG